MKLLITLATRYLAGRKLRTTLTTLAIMFGVLVIFGMNILLPALLQAFQANMLAASGKVDLTVTHQSGEAFPVDLVNQIAQVDGVRSVTGSLNRPIALPLDYLDHDPAKTDAITTLNLVGVDPETAQTVYGYVIKTGRFLQTGDRGTAVISTSLAEALGVKVGQPFKLPTTQGEVSLEVIGLLPRKAVPGNEDVFVSLPEVQYLTSQTGLINIIEADYDTTNEAKRKEIDQKVSQLLGADFRLGALPTSDQIFASLKTGQFVMNLFGFLALFMGGFIIFNTFRTVVAERRRDIGMLRAVGASRRTISGLFLTESVLQGVTGTATGLLVGYLIGAVLLKAMVPMMNQFIHISIGAPVITPSTLFISIALGVGVTVVAGFLPAIQASRVTPLEALRPSTADVHFNRNAGFGLLAGISFVLLAILALLSKNLGLIAPGGLLFLIGLVLVGPALVRPITYLFGRLISLVYARDGIDGLAEGNLNRQPSRAAVTASATMIGLAVIVAAGGLTSSVTIGFLDVLKKSLGSDYLLIPPSISLWGADIGADHSLADQLKQVEGVEAVSTLRFANSSTEINSLLGGKFDQVSSPDGKQSVVVSILGIDPVAFPKVSGLYFSKGNEKQAYADLAKNRATIINGVLATAAGLKVGDDLILTTLNGKHAYKVVAVANDFLDAKVQVAYISQTNLKTDFKKSDDIFIQINLKDEANQAGADQQIKALTSAYPQFQIIAGKAYYDEIKQTLNVVFSGLYLVLIFLALPSLIAMTNTLAIAVIERTREIGMLRAVGSTRRQVRKMIVAEALLLASIGTAFGILAGLYLSYVMMSALKTLGFPVVYAFPGGGVLVGIAVGLLFGVLAALIPAKQAAEMRIVEALRYE